MKRARRRFILVGENMRRVYLAAAQVVGEVAKFVNVARLRCDGCEASLLKTGYMPANNTFVECSECFTRYFIQEESDVDHH